MSALFQSRVFRIADVAEAPPSERPPNDQGFDESLLMAGVLHLPEDHPDTVNSKQMFDPLDRFPWTMGGYAVRYNGGPEFEPEGHTTDYYTDQAVKVIENNRNRPFFLSLAHWGIHTPLQSTKEDYDAYPNIESHTERTYAGMIRALDRSVGRVLEALRDNGLDENTIVIFTSDNGGAGYIGLPDVNRPYRGWKLTLFEGGVHVPYMMRWPAGIPAGQRYDEPVHHFDIYATAVAAAGAEMPTDRKMDVVDLLPKVRDEADGVLHEDWKLQRSGPNDEFVWLFDMADDPTEQNNLASELPEKFAELDAVLAVHLAEQAPPRWPSRAAAAISIDKHLNQPESPDDEFVYYPN